jgi:hypothetical protein
MGTSGTLRHTLHLTTTNGTPYLVLEVRIFGSQDFQNTFCKNLLRDK